MESVFIPASRRGATQSNGMLSYGGYLCSFQKELAGGRFCSKCAQADRNFKRAEFAVTDGSVAGAASLRFGGHASHCEPTASVADVARIRQDVMANACGVGGVTPTRAVSQCLAKSPHDIAHSLPPHGVAQVACAERIAQSAEKGGGRRRGRSCSELPVARGACYPSTGSPSGRRRKFSPSR